MTNYYVDLTPDPNLDTAANSRLSRYGGHLILKGPYPNTEYNHILLTSDSESFSGEYAEEYSHDLDEMYPFLYVITHSTCPYFNEGTLFSTSSEGYYYSFEDFNDYDLSPMPVPLALSKPIKL